MRQTLLLASLILLSALLFSRILTNRPAEGDELDILVEGGGNGPVQLVRPDRRVINSTLSDGQLRYPADMPGTWEVKAGGDKVVVDVAAAAGSGRRAGEGGRWAGGIAAIALLALVIIFSAGAGVALLLRPRGARACLEKRRQGGQVKVRLHAGALVLQSVKLCDEGGPRWEGGPLRLAARRLENGQALEMEYEYDGPLGAARAEFFEDGKNVRLECTEGQACSAAGEENGEPRDAPTALQGRAAEMPPSKPRRKLSRA